MLPADLIAIPIDDLHELVFGATQAGSLHGGCSSLYRCSFRKAISRSLVILTGTLLDIVYMQRNIVHSNNIMLFSHGIRVYQNWSKLVEINPVADPGLLS